MHDHWKYSALCLPSHLSDHRACLCAERCASSRARSKSADSCALEAIEMEDEEEAVDREEGDEEAEDAEGKISGNHGAYRVCV